MHNLVIRWRSSPIVLLLGLVLAGCSGVEKGVAPAPERKAEAQKGQDARTALDEYVAAPDTNYSFHLVNTIPGPEQTTFIVEMTSQAWLTTDEVDHPAWKHWLLIVKP